MLRLFGFVVVGALAGAAPAQTLIATLVGPTGPSGQTAFGASAAALGDVDGDGSCDLAVTDPTWHGFTQFGPIGRVWVVSGRTHAILDAIDPVVPVAGFAVGPAAAADAGDVDGDGLADVIAQAGLVQGGDAVVVRSPAALMNVAALSGPRLRAFGVGDLDSDGLGDVALRTATQTICAPLSVRYQEQLDIGDLHPVPAPPSLSIGYLGACLGSSPFPPALAFWDAMPLGDVTGDALPDVLVLTNTGIAGSISLLAPVAPPSGQTAFGFQLVWTLPADPTRQVARAGDCDGDGLTDFATLDAPAPGGFFTVRSGATGAMIAQHPFDATDGGAPGSGSSICAAGDADRDGFGDVAVTRLGVAGDTIWIYSGRDGTRILRIDAPPGTHFSGSAAVSGDADGDGIPDLAIGTDAQTVLVFSLAPLGVSYPAPGCAPPPLATPAIGVRGTPAAGTTMTVFLSGVAAGAFGTLVLGFSDQSFGGIALPLDLGFAGLPGCLLRVSPDALDGAIAAPAGALGAAQLTYVLPPSLPPGLVIHAQWLVAGYPGDPILAGVSGSVRLAFY
jgi:hypothetical protein